MWSKSWATNTSVRMMFQAQMQDDAEIQLVHWSYNSKTVPDAHAEQCNSSSCLWGASGTDCQRWRVWYSWSIAEGTTIPMLKDKRIIREVNRRWCMFRTHTYPPYIIISLGGCCWCSVLQNPMIFYLNVFQLLVASLSEIARVLLSLPPWSTPWSLYFPHCRHFNTTSCTCVKGLVTL